MDSCWPSPGDARPPTRDQRPLLGRLLLVPNQQIIQEQYETPQQQSRPGDKNSIMDPLIEQPLSFKSNPRDCDNFLMAPTEPRRLSSTSNDSELSCHSSQSDLFANEVFGACQNKSTNHTMGINIGLKYAERMHYREDRVREEQSRRRSSACSSLSTDSDRGSWRLSATSTDKRLLSWDSRRDSGQSSHSLRRNSSFNNYNDQVKTSGMELVPAWLKLLRLHKYTELIMGLGYEEMITLTEEQLEQRGVTKGARRKIVANIAKLRDRPRILAEMSAHLDRDDCSVKKVITELEILIKSPVKIGGERRERWRHDSGRDSGAEVSEDDCEEGLVCTGARLVEMIMAVLRKTCSILLLAHNTDLKNVSHFISLLDTCLGRDCYNNHHKQLLISWKQKLNSIWMTSGLDRRGGGSRSRSRLGPLQRSSSGGAAMDFPISHWSAHDQSREHSSGQHVREEGLGQRKRLSLQNDGDVSVPWSSKSLTHRYSLPILRPETNFEGNPTLQENIIWDNSMYKDKDETKSQKRRQMYTAPRELDYEKKNEIMNKEANPMYKDDIKSRSSQYSNICLDQVSDAELDSRLAHLCLSVTKNALE